jgi:hypothetical protein
MKACRFSKQLQGRQVDAKEGLYFQALTSLVCENGACILCVGGSDGCVHMYSPEDDLVFVQVRYVIMLLSMLFTEQEGEHVF